VSRSLSLDEAFEFIQKPDSKLLHSPSIEGEAFYRLRYYPAQIQQNMHNSAVIIPRKLACLIHKLPASISPAVDAFYLRDPIALKLLNPTKQNQQLIFPPEDMVKICVKFPKAGFAQIKSQHFETPTPWKKAVPSTADAGYAAMETGMKISCGYEMLIGDSKNKDRDIVKSLKAEARRLDENKHSLITDEELSTWPQNEDDEKWLDVNFEEFDNELSGKTKPASSSKTSQTFGDRAAQENLNRLVERFQSIMGDENEDEDDDDDEAGTSDTQDEDERDSSDSDESLTLKEGEDKAGSFDEAEFELMMREMMGLPPEEPKLMPKTAQVKGIAKRNEVKAKTEELRNSTLAQRLRGLYNSDEDEDDSEDDRADDSESDVDPEALRDMMAKLEAELNSASVLATENEQGDSSSGKGKGKASVSSRPELDESDAKWIEAALNKNLREGFKPDTLEK
jgi:hypothetical protein